MLKTNSFYCRTCANSSHFGFTFEKTKTLISSEWCNQLFKLLNIELNDRLPQQICLKCWNQLQNFGKFLENCKASQITLIELYPNAIEADKNEKGYSLFEETINEPLSESQIKSIHLDDEKDSDGTIDILEESENQNEIVVEKRVVSWRCNFCNETNETHLKAHQNILQNIMKEFDATEGEAKNYYAGNFKKFVKHGSPTYYNQLLEKSAASTRSKKSFIQCPILYCPYCERRCRSDESLENHLNYKHQTLYFYFKQKDQNLNCPYCSKKCYNKRKLNLHLKTDHRSKINMEKFILICPFCKFFKKYCSKISFSKHLDDRHKTIYNSTVKKLKETLGQEKIEYNITETLKLSAALNLIELQVYEGLEACKTYYDDLRIEELMQDIKGRKSESGISTNIKVENMLNKSNSRKCSDDDLANALETLIGNENPVATNEAGNLDFQKSWYDFAIINSDEEKEEEKYNKRTTCGSPLISESDSENNFDSDIDNIIDLPYNFEINYEGDNILCKYCPNKYQSTNKYSKHLHRTHTFEQQRESVIICPHCKEGKEKFTSFKRFNEHLKNFHPFANDTENIEADHYITEEQLCKYTVQRAGDMFPSEEDTEDKYTPLCNRAFVNCVLCFAKFDNLEKITNHLKNKHEAAPTSQKLIPTKTCETCEEVVQLRFYKDHASYHVSDASNLPYMCDTCGQRYRQKRALTEHMACHNTNKKYKCGNCDESFDNTYKLKKHRTIFHPEFSVPVQGETVKKERKKYRNTKYADLECPFCNKLLKNAVTYVSHLRIHNKPIVSRHVCSYCQVTFRRADHLKLHVANTHTNEKPFKCDFCDKSFAANFLKTDHTKRVHKNKAGRTVYECMQCHKTFDNRTRLQIHIKDKHNINQETQYICPICNDRFLYHRQLMSHSSAHDEEFITRRKEFIDSAKNIDSEENSDVDVETYVIAEDVDVDIIEEADFIDEGDVIEEVEEYVDDFEGINQNGEVVQKMEIEFNY